MAEELLGSHLQLFLCLGILENSFSKNHAVTTDTFSLFSIRASVTELQDLDGHRQEGHKQSTPCLCQTEESSRIDWVKL